MSYMSDDEKQMLEELLNRVIDAEEGDASSGLHLAKKQADRILAYRKEQDERLAKYREETPKVESAL